MEEYILSVLVSNHSGVLSRVSSLFGQRGYNIASLTVSATSDDTISRITLVVRGDEYILEQIVKQLSKLEDVIKVHKVDAPTALCRELLLLKVSIDAATLTKIKEAAELFRAKIIDVAPASIILELTGQESKINAFLEFLSPYTIIEMCRTGITAMERGSKAVLEL